MFADATTISTQYYPTYTTGVEAKMKLVPGGNTSAFSPGTSISQKLGYIAEFFAKLSKDRNDIHPPKVILLVDDETRNIDIKIIEKPKGIDASTTAIHFKDRLVSVQKELNLSITQLADIFGVTRKSIYDWLDGAEPRAGSQSKVEILADIAKSSPVNLSKLKNVWSIPLSGTSFKNIIQDEALDYESTRALALEKISELAPRLANSEKARPTKIRMGNAHLSDLERNIDVS